MNELQTVIRKLQGLANVNTFNENFPSYIKKIHFPFYKNLEAKTEIKFDFPLTVFVGQNGCGKSSALQALFGCPSGKSTGDYWFNTHTDPIVEEKNDVRNSYWYEYFNPAANRDVQILKYRSQFRKKQSDGTFKINPDYWEPARPGDKYGMDAFEELPKGISAPGREATRWEILKKDVLYLDFRSELSAFDKYFYFEDEPNSPRFKSKQDYLRHYSAKLQQLFDGSVKSHFRKIRNGNGRKRSLNDPCDLLSKPEIDAICNITGKKYDSAKIVRHSLYKQNGLSVRFESKRTDSSELNYTEAYAGSGEISIVILVHQVINAPPNSLILLDEPEVSLHPGAQKRMLKFLLDEIYKKKHQIILCTHSPTLIETLPEVAIKLFSPTPEGYFKVYPKTLPSLAFSHIGHTITNKIRIIVEDEAAKQLVNKVISLNEHWSDLYEVDFHLGGAKDIFKEAVALSRVKEKNLFFILDGDEKRKLPIDIGQIGESQLNDEITSCTGINISELQFAANSGSDKISQLNNEKKNYLQYLNDFFRFLPGNIPEETIILASKFPGKPTWTSDVESGMNAKKALQEWLKTEIDVAEASDFLTYRKRLLKEIDSEHGNIKTIKSIVEGFQILKNSK